MRTASNGKTILQNLTTLIQSFSQNEIDEFRRFSRRKSGKSEKKYMYLFEWLVKQINDNKASEEDIEAYYREHYPTTNEKRNTHRDLVKLLYDMLLKHIGEVHKQEEKWKEDIWEGLFAVQGLMRRNHHSLAKMRLKELEKQKRYSLFVILSGIYCI